MTLETFREGLAAIPPFVSLAWVLALGLILGSFANVVIHRLPRGESLVHPRSRCPGCSRLVRWHENIPVLSWLLLRARCAGCRTRISWRYPAVEALMAALFGLAHVRFGLSWGLVLAALACFLVTCLVFIDAEHFLLPDALTLRGTFAALALSWMSPFVTPAGALAGCLFAATLLEGLNLAYCLVRGHDGLGAGDTKMLMLVGALLGWEMTLFTLLAASVTGLAIGVPALAYRRRRAVAAAARLAPDARAVPSAAQGLAADAAPEPGLVPETEERPPSALMLLLPERPADLLLLLGWGVLVLSFLEVVTTPAQALLGLLVGLALRHAADFVRMRWRGHAERERRLELLPLLLATAGLPPTTRGLAAAAGLLALVVLAARPLERFLLRHAPRRPAADDGIGPPAERPGASLMQLPLPLGVFLGLGALVALFAGSRIVDWYFDVWLLSSGRS